MQSARRPHLTKLVCRLLDAEDRLLGWCWHIAAMRGDGCLRSTLPVWLDVDAAGEPKTLSVHWADMNVEVRVPWPNTVRAVTPGQALVIFEANTPMLRAGDPPLKRLPPVSTKQAVDVSVPVGQFGATGVAV